MSSEIAHALPPIRVGIRLLRLGQGGCPGRSPSDAKRHLVGLRLLILH